MKNSIFYVLPISIICLTSIAQASEPEVCGLLKQEKKYIPYSESNRPVMYLVDEAGKIIHQPVDIGTYFYQPEDFAIVKTNYTLLVYPKRIKATSSGEGRSSTAILQPIKSFCKNANAYKITYQGVYPQRMEYVELFRKKLPLKINEPFHFPYFEDTEIDEGVSDVTPICRFDCRFVGTIVDGSKK